MQMKREYNENNFKKRGTMMDNRVGPLRVILLALLTVLILAILAGAALYLRDSMLMREGDINYNAGDYNSALARYKVLQDSYLFKQESFQKADYCNYNLAREAMENEQWEEAKGYLNEVKSFELDSVGKLLKECDEGLEAEADRLRSYDKIFLEDLERAITLRLDPDDDGDVVVREQMFLKDYDHRYFQDQKLRDYALRYLDALQRQYDARSEIYKSERDLAINDARLLNYEVLDGLYRDYQFMADNVQFVGEFIGELPRIREYNASLHEVYADMHRQIDRTATWPAETNYAYRYTTDYRNNTQHTISLQFFYYIYTWNRQRYLEESGYAINDIPPQTNYKVVMTEPDNQAGVNFLVDWVVTGIDGYGGTVEEAVGD